MNAAPSCKRLHRLWLTVTFALAPSAFTSAQDASPAATPANPLAGVSVQVLDQQQVNVGTHSLTFNRLAPPVFAAAAPMPGSTSTRAAPRAKHSTKAQTRRVAKHQTARRSTRDEADKGNS